MASEGTLLPGHCSQKTHKGADKAPFLHHLLEKPVEMSVAGPLFPQISLAAFLADVFPRLI